MPKYLHPGVYVSEAPGSSHLIQAASTSVACFVGEAAMGCPFAPTLVTSFTHYSRIFGSSEQGEQGDLPLAARHFFDNGGSQLYIVRVVAVDALAAKARIHDRVQVEAAGPGAWGNDLEIHLKQNAFHPTRVDLSVRQKQPDGRYEDVEHFAGLGFDPSKAKFFASIVNRDSNTIHFPRDAQGHLYQESIPGGALGDLGLKAPEGQTLAECTISLGGGTDGDGGAISTQSLDQATQSLSALRDISILAVPGVWRDNLLTGVIAWVSHRKDMILILDGPGDPHNQMARTAQLEAVKTYQKSVANHEFVALYFPWLEIPDPFTSVAGATRYAPPSGFMAGLYARTDQACGVWKAPAGTEATLLGAVGVAVDLSDSDQDNLNPVGINAIRTFGGVGIVCWGARTQAPAGGAYLYVPVRRTEIYLRKSLDEGTRWAVFEPNDAPVWRSITNSVDAFMSTQFRSGAFQGGSPREAYFVRCDSTNNDQASIDAGQVHIMVGFAPLKPAEFVLIQLTQTIQDAGTA